MGETDFRSYSIEQAQKGWDWRSFFSHYPSAPLCLFFLPHSFFLSLYSVFGEEVMIGSTKRRTEMSMKNRWGQACMGACRYGRVIVDMGAALAPKRRTSKRKGQGEERHQPAKERPGRKGERKAPLCLSRQLGWRRGCRERDTAEWRQRGEFSANTRCFSPLCSGALRYPTKTISFLPQLFPDLSPNRFVASR